MMPLPIVWQRLVRDGETCPRCGETGQELQRALDSLRIALRPLGIEPRLEAQEVGEAAFAAEPLSSNRLWIAGRPLEDWLGARVGQSRCCAACGDAECRTLELGDRRFEAVPAELIVEAALQAAAEVLGDRRRHEASACCPRPAKAPACCEPGGCS
jgi:hypothetical protein